MRVLASILAVILLGLPLGICWKMVPAGSLPDWIWVPLTVVPPAYMYAKCRTKGKDRPMSYYYGAWAATMWALAGLLALFRWEPEPLVQMLKAGTVLFLLALVMRALEVSEIFGQLAKYLQRE